LNILAFKHFDFDDPQAIAQWAALNGHRLTVADPSAGVRAEWLEQTELLVIMGGPMSVYDEAECPWLKAEKRWVEQAIRREIGVLGICLGAQMLADVLGGRVYRHKHKEIGWHPIARTTEKHPLFEGMPERFYSFQWHADTYDLPHGAVRLARSEGCGEQAFAYSDHVLALQFHLEATPSCIGRMLTEWESELTEPGPFVQSASAIREACGRSRESHRMLHGLLTKTAMAAGVQR